MEKLKKQIEEELKNLTYTYIAHHEFANKELIKNSRIEFAQIILTSFLTLGFLSNSYVCNDWGYIAGGVLSAISLGLNLYANEFRMVEIAQRHKNAADELWLLKNQYKSLLVDFDYLPYEEKIAKRNGLILEIDRINRTYPATDKDSYSKAEEKHKQYN